MCWQRNEECFVPYTDHHRFRPQQCAALWPCAWSTGRSRKAITGLLASQLSVLLDKAATATMGLKQTQAALARALPRPRSLLPSRTAECQACHIQDIDKPPCRSPTSCPQPVVPNAIPCCAVMHLKSVIRGPTAVRQQCGPSCSCAQVPIPEA